jgi:DNA-binding XRE family transcriptional regulator
VGTRWFVKNQNIGNVQDGERRSGRIHSMSHLSTRVKALREAKRRTQQELASESGVSVTTISRYENERVTMFSAKVLERLAEALDVHPGLLLVKVK